LDLLLFFIRRDELDIYDIPISHITAEFLSYVRMMQLLDLELAGEFIVMAATLMQIKARMLLPRTSAEDGEDELDPRAELTRRLVEYRRYKEAAQGLQEREHEQRMRFFRACFSEDIKRSAPVDDEEFLRDVTLFHLIAAFQRAMSTMSARVVHEVQAIPWRIEEQGLFLMDFFAGRDEYHFLELLDEMHDKMQLVVTFIALLELIKAQRLRIRVKAAFNDFIIRRVPAD